MARGTTARGYGWQHQQARAAWAPIVEAGGATCWRCRQPIAPGTAWDLGHDDHDRTVTHGPEHRHATDQCPGNRSAGARTGSARRNGLTVVEPQPTPRTRWT